MPRIARVVVPGEPHHVTQRGNRRANVFFTDGDRRRYLELLGEYAGEQDLTVLAWCLMSNHVHLVVVPPSETALAACLGPLHLRYAQHVNRTQSVAGRLWQGRYYSCVLDEPHLTAAVRYVERNPVRAGLAAQAEDYPWSSAAAHCGLRPDPLLATAAALPSWGEAWQQWLAAEEPTAVVDCLRTSTRTGRPLGEPAFIGELEARLGRRLTARHVGRPRK